MEAHLTSSLVFMIPPGRCPDKDPFSPRPSSNSSLLLLFSSFSNTFSQTPGKLECFPHSLKPSSTSRRPKRAFQRAPLPSNSTLLCSSPPLVLSCLLQSFQYSFPSKLSCSFALSSLFSFLGLFLCKPLLWPHIHWSASMAFSNHPLQLHASCRRPLALSWGSPTSTVCSFPNPLYKCRILIAPQSTNLILCQPLQRRHVVSQDRATWSINLHER